MTHNYLIDIIHEDGNRGKEMKFFLSNDNIENYCNKLLKNESIEEVIVYRQYVTYDKVKSFYK